MAGMIARHNWGGSDRLIYRLLLTWPGLTDREGAQALELSGTTYRMQRWRLACSGLVRPLDARARPRRWLAVREADA